MPSDHNPDGWTFATLYTHVMALSEASKQAVTAAMNAAGLATQKAEAASEKRLEGMNEFRAAMKDQQSTFADKEQTNFRLSAIDKELAKISGKSQGISTVGSLIIGASIVISAAITIAGFVINFEHH